MYRNKKVSVVLPTYNEEQSIAQVINDFFATGFVDEVIAIDNNARGKTAEEIKKTKATYILESKNQGYGHAIMRGLKESTGDLIIMCEADGTFDPKDIEKFLIYSNDFDVVFGTRTSRAMIWSGAFMPFPVRFGNWFVAKILEVIHNGPTLTDVGCTFKLISRNAYNKIEDLLATSDGSGTFSPELMIWLLRRKFKPIEIPVTYKQRVGESMYTGSTWRAAKLGFVMIWLIIKMRFRKI
jgi:glycosyltransferase involved in cell wall biosynthesis